MTSKHTTGDMENKALLLFVIWLPPMVWIVSTGQSMGAPEEFIWIVLTFIVIFKKFQ